MNEEIKNRYLEIRRDQLSRLCQRPNGYLASRVANYGTKGALIDAKSDRSPYFRESHLGHGDVIRVKDKHGNRRTFTIAILPDNDMGAPWKEHCGHGPVSEWTSRAKEPGELILNEERGSKRYYDFKAACAIARRDGWNAKPYDIEGETPRQRAAKAAIADYERLRAWCNDEWQWIGVCVFEMPRDGQWRAPESYADSEPWNETISRGLWGIESDSPDYHESVAWELVQEIIHES